MKSKLSLRLKITIINTLILVLCSVLLTISTTSLASKSMDLLSSSSSAQEKITDIEEDINDTVEDDVNYTMDENIEMSAPTTKATQTEKERFIISSWAYMIGIIILGSITTYFTTNKSLESLKNLNKEIKDISEHNLSKEISEEESDQEIKGIINSFNKMLNRINEAFESQKQFSANVAHELRTPLAVIQMKIDVFKKRKVKTSDDYEKLIEVVEKHNERLIKVVDELLSISNNENVELKDKICFTKIIESVKNELKELSLQRNIKIDIFENKMNNEEKELYGNEQLMYRVIYNLLENAIKYNKDDGYVKIYINEYEDYIDISIKDSGIGISKEEQENVFKPFYRVDKSRSRKMGGSGLGLSIVKNIINQHNGDINIKSDNSGTEFNIKMPYN